MQGGTSGNIRRPDPHLTDEEAVAAGHEAQGGAAASHTSHPAFLLLLLNSHVPIPTLAERVWYCAPTWGGPHHLINLRPPSFTGKFELEV